MHGVPERKFGGLDGFFAWLERRKYKMHIRVFLSRWRSYRPCPACGGTRLRPEALVARIGGKNIGEICAMKVRDAAAFFRKLELPDWQRQVGRMMLEQVQARLGYLEAVGLGYLTLDRTLRTLSGGEARRVALTSALGSSLVNMLYVLDEPSIGLHPRDINQLLAAIKQLRDRSNTVVVVEHEEAIIRAADQVIEIGPGAGERGGKIVFQGTPAEMEQSPDSFTGDYLAGRRGFGGNGRRREPNHGWIRLAGAGQQPQERHRRVSAGRVVPGHRRERIGQEHAGAGHALSGPLPPAAQRRPEALSARRRVRRRPARRRDHGRSKPDRPLAALQSGDLPEGVRRDSGRVRRYGRGPHAGLQRRALQLQRRRRRGATPARATATSRSTCSSWPTFTCAARSATARATATRFST